MKIAPSGVIAAMTCYLSPLVMCREGEFFLDLNKTQSVTLTQTALLFNAYVRGSLQIASKSLSSSYFQCHDPNLTLCSKRAK